MSTTRRGRSGVSVGGAGRLARLTVAMPTSTRLAAVESARRLAAASSSRPASARTTVTRTRIVAD